MIIPSRNKLITCDVVVSESERRMYRIAVLLRRFMVRITARVFLLLMSTSRNIPSRATQEEGFTLSFGINPVRISTR
jgi:hypothetical protein